MASYMGFITMSTCSSLRSLQYTSQVIRVKKKATPPVRPSFRGGDQSTIPKNASNHHVFQTDHLRLMRQMHSTEEESCSQTRNAQKKRELGEAALEKPQPTTEELVGAAPNAILCECK
ncbi:hypothetical protein TcCL_Unassigned00057 [Trypanosoma cruzi]|nr:hypothetical protein TcCL_Unassigned00057 [Trypanosoma cruzi]